MKRPIGMNLFTWTTTMDDDLSGLLSFLKNTGFDFVEIPINEPGDVEKWQRIGQQCANLGLAVQTCTICPPHKSLISPDEAVRRAGVTYLNQVVDASAAVGSRMLMGPLYAGFKTFTGQPPTQQEFDWSVAGMRAVAEHAQTQNVTLAIEYLNRFEVYLLTCADDVRRYIDAVDHPHCRASFDTFHANIEEKSIPDAIRTLAPYLAQVQVSENDRATPGKGHINFNDVFATLNEIGFAGPVCIEAFGLTPPDLAAAANIVRKMFASPEQLAAEGLAFIKSAVGGHSLRVIGGHS